MTGDGSKEMDHGRRMTINLFSYIKLRSYNQAQICRLRCTAGATCRSSNAEYDPESDPELQQQCRYHTSGTRLIVSGATIFKEGDDSAGFATTLNANNYRTGNAGTKHHEMHSQIEKASNGEKCTLRSDGKRTYR
jgi:hypothetical protein